MEILNKIKKHGKMEKDMENGRYMIRIGIMTKTELKKK